MPYVKIKIISLLSFVVFALFMFLVFRNYILEEQNNSVDANIINTKTYIKKSINFLINEKKQFYITSSNIIFSNDKLIKALENNDRGVFYQEIKKDYSRLRSRDVDFWGLHIILSNNMSFIRVHKPQVKDKRIVKGIKPFIDKVNQTQQQITSFDAGKFGYFLRVVTPIFSKQKKYLAAAEFSINVGSLTQYIKNKFGYEVLFLIKDEQNKIFLAPLEKTANGLTIFKSTHKTIFKNYPFEAVNNSKLVSTKQYIVNKGNSYSIVVIKLSDTASLAVAFDVTNIVNEQKLFKENLTSLISFVLLIFLIIWFVATKFYIRNKIQIDSQIHESHVLISKNVIFSNTDLKGIITDVSDAFCHISGYTREQLIGQSHSLIRHPDMDESSYKDLWETLQANKVWISEIKSLKQNGESYWVKATISPHFDSDHKKVGYMSIKQDITDKKIIEKISITDGLTGIYNRRHFDFLFQRIINTSKRHNELVCFLIMDVDYFKQYNDTYGHQMGDDVLKTIAKSLEQSLQRADDYCFRLGGEEFGVIFKAENKQSVMDFAEEIRGNIEKIKIRHSASSISNYITASFGVICQKAKNIKDADQIYKQTDDLLYQAKKTGRNKVILNL